MEIEQAFEKFSRGQINLFALRLTWLGGGSAAGSTIPNGLNRYMFLRKVDKTTYSVPSWRTWADAENFALNELKLPPGVFLIFEFNQQEFEEFYKTEQRRGCKVFLEIDGVIFRTE